MVRDHSPTVRRRRLSAELRRLRDQAQLTIDDVAEKLTCSASKISRIETGHVSVTPRDTREMLKLYGVEPEQLEALVQLAKEARKKGWWHSYSEVFTGAFVGLEAETSSLRAYQALLVPGLLQTEDYMRAVIRAARPDATEAHVAKRVKARLARQRLLTDVDPPRYWAVIDEAVLCRTVGGPRVMHAQLNWLIARASLPHVTIQVLPFSAGAHAGMEGPFLILGFPEQADPDVVYVDNTTAGSYLEEPADILRYTLMFDYLRAAALAPDDTLTRIAAAAARLS
ncbi:MAG TPA: helix-turn-helix transcriptional regulator [Pseudonocardiaceae bacterium]|jgi:transcriptional regulator with XRE-family HTH domain